MKNESLVKMIGLDKLFLRQNYVLCEYDNDLCYIPLDDDYPLYDSRIIVAKNIEPYKKNYAIYYNFNETSIKELTWDGYACVELSLIEYLDFTRWINEQLKRVPTNK